VDEAPRPVEALRERLAVELRGAMKARDALAVATLRSLLSALDNAGAVAVTKAHTPVFGLSGDVPRRELTADEVEAVLVAEADERAAAAADYERRGLREGAERLQAELAIIARFLPPKPTGTKSRP
jgi:uncharacterized protein YqeY